MFFNIFFAAFEHVHGNVRLVSVLEFHRSFANFDNFIGREQPHSVN